MPNDAHELIAWRMERAGEFAAVPYFWYDNIISLKHTSQEPKRSML
jgi:hypothetical protein